MSPVLTLIRRCGAGAFSVKIMPEHAAATKRQRFCRRILASSKGLAMLIRSETNGSIDGASSARTIAAAYLPAHLPTLDLTAGRIADQSLGLGLLLLSCP
jgi:hypothetical protein